MFNFFKIVHLDKNIKHNSEVVSYCNNSSYNVFCNRNDEVIIFWKDWDCLTLQIENVRFCCIPENADYLILLCQNKFTSNIFLNVYNFSTQAGRKVPTLIGNSILESNAKVTALSALSSSETILFLSIGLENGSIFFYKSTLQKEIPPGAFMYFSVTTKPIKGIKFTQNKENVSMFVCSDAGIFCYTISNKPKLNETKLILDDMESSIHCITLKPSFELLEEQYLVIARDNGLYCYTAEGRGPCYAISGHKQIVEWLGKHLIIVLKSKTCMHLPQITSEILIYDVDNKIIVLNKEFEEVISLLPISGHSNCLIFLKNGEILTLREQEMKYKLAHLIKKKLYDVALKILEEYKANLDVVSDILVQYGDYLLQRGDSSGAVIVYTKTIGTTPPFLIIRRLMDFRHNKFLIQYLSELVQRDFKTTEHVELLNNCFRRINLSKSTFRVFEIEQLYVDYVSINHSENVTLIINSLKENQAFPLNFFHNCSNIAVIQFLLEYGYYFIKEYPNTLKEFIKYALSDKILTSNMFNRILLPLSLINKLSALHFINNLKDYDKNTIHVLTELILQMWYKGHIDTNFVIDFFISHEPEVCIDNVFILCRHYEFWPGIEMMYAKCCIEILSAHCVAKCFEFFPEYVNVNSQENFSKNLNQMMILTLKGENLAKNNIIKFTSNLVKNMMNTNPYYILRILNNFVSCTNFLISQLDEFVVQDKFLTYFKCDELNNIVSFLENRVIEMEEVVHNYLRRPIEFRNRSCDICKQVIKQPSVFFLCQHSFHKQCFTQFSEIFECIICKEYQKSKFKTKNFTQSYRDNSNNESDYTILLKMSKKIDQLPFKCGGKGLKTETVPNSMKLKEYESLQHSNPFENTQMLKRFTYNEYDDNLNPFSN